MRRIDKAFRIMEEMGLVAKQKYGRCSANAISGITREVERKIEDGTPVSEIMGVVFYSEDEAYVLRNGGLLGFELFIRYGNVDSKKHGIVGMPTHVVGGMAVKALVGAGIKYSWNGSPLIMISADARSCCEEI